jgi:hypothetical protein
MLTSTPSLDSVLQCLLPAFTQPSFQTHVEVLLGWVMCLSKRTEYGVFQTIQPKDHAFPIRRKPRKRPIATAADGNRGLGDCPNFRVSENGTVPFQRTGTVDLETVPIFVSAKMGLSPFSRWEPWTWGLSQFSCQRKWDCPLCRDSRRCCSQ